jgi:hypothetical protein
MLRYVFVLSIVIISSSVNAQVEKEMACSTAAVDATENLDKLITHLDDVSAPSMDMGAGKLDDKVVRQICGAAQDTLQQANSIKSTVSSLKGCSTADARKMADIAIKLAKALIDQQKCH